MGKGASPARRFRRSAASRLRRRADDGRRRPAPRRRHPAPARSRQSPSRLHRSSARACASARSSRRIAAWPTISATGASPGAAAIASPTARAASASIRPKSCALRRRARRGLRVRGADPDFRRAAARHALRVGADRIALPRPCTRRAVPHQPFPPVARSLRASPRHIVAQMPARGGVPREYRRIRAHPPVIDDPTGEFGTAVRDHCTRMQERMNMSRAGRCRRSSEAASPG